MNGVATSLHAWFFPEKGPAAERTADPERRRDVSGGAVVGIQHPRQPETEEDDREKGHEIDHGFTPQTRQAYMVTAARTTPTSDG